jgi:glutamyl-Q tRNA(Asp) synthetase
MAFVTRFAPSPTGYLHLGHAFSALTALEAARAAGGRFLLRIEDIDATRVRPEFEAAIYEDLAWLGLDWETPVRRQSEHLADYAAALDRLIGLGVMYRCFKTRREVMEAIQSAPHGPGEAGGDIYFGQALPPGEEAARLAAEEPFAWRISMARCRDLLGADWDRLFFIEEGSGPGGETGEIRARPELLGDAVLARKDVATSYHLACTHDDALQGVTHVIRGRDLFESTHLHRLLQALLGLAPPRYRHHRLVEDGTGTRLAKRTGSPSLRETRASGASPDTVRRSLLGPDE